jgi:hypothetical protein
MPSTESSGLNATWRISTDLRPRMISAAICVVGVPAATENPSVGWTWKLSLPNLQKVTVGLQATTLHPPTPVDCLACLHPSVTPTHPSYPIHTPSPPGRTAWHCYKHTHRMVPTKEKKSPRRASKYLVRDSSWACHSSNITSRQSRTFGLQKGFLPGSDRKAQSRSSTWYL